MGFRKKNRMPSNGTPEPVAEQSAVQPAETAKKAKKKGVGMASLFTETVPEQILDELNANTPFVTEIDGVKKYIAVMFTAESIGGLDKKTASKDEAKGQLVQQLESGAIKSYFTPQTLEEEKIIFVPNTQSMMNVEEFGIVRNTPWTFVAINQDAEIEELNVQTSYDEVQEIIEGKKTLEQVMTNVNNFKAQPVAPAESDTSSDVVEDASPLDEYSDEPEAPSEIVDDVPDDVPAIDDIPDDVPEDIIPSEEPEDIPFDDGDDIPSDDDGGNDLPPIDDEFVAVGDDGDGDDSDDEDRPLDYNDVDVNKEITRRFYSDDLGLEVPMAPFDAYYVDGNKYIPFEENRPEGWLNNYLNEKCRNANVKLSRIHTENIKKIKLYYIETMNKHCEDIIKALDTQNVSTDYGQLKLGIDKTRTDEIARLDDKVAQRKLELNQEWDRKLAEVAEQGAQDARNRYRERYGRQHDEDLTHIGPILRDEIDANYSIDIRNLNDERRKEAQKRLDYAINETLAECNTLYEKLTDAEIAEYRQLEGDVQDYLDDNRKNDVAHDQALAEELAQIQKADVVRNEYQSKMAALKEEFEAKKATLNADIEKMARDHENALKKQDSDWTAKYNEEKAIVETQRTEISGLLEKYAILDEQKKKEYASLITELKNEKEASDGRYQDAVDSNKRSHRIALFLAIICVIAAVAIGFITGYFVYSKMAAKSANEAIVAEYNQRIQELESKYNTPTETTTSDGSTTVIIRTPNGTETSETTTETTGASETTTETSN